MWNAVGLGIGECKEEVGRERFTVLDFVNSGIREYRKYV